VNYKIRSFGLAGAVAALALLWQPQNLHSQAGNSVVGSYGFSESGKLGGNLNMVGVGILTLHADGSISGAETAQVDTGLPVRSSFQGSFRIEQDGTGEMTLVLRSRLIGPAGVGCCGRCCRSGQR